jgi:hypothetical protein
MMTNWWDKAVKEYTDKLDAERKERAETLRTQLRDILGMQTNPDSGVLCLEYENKVDLYATATAAWRENVLFFLRFDETSYGITVYYSKLIHNTLEAGETLTHMDEWLKGRITDDILEDLLYSYPSFAGKTFLDET